MALVERSLVEIDHRTHNQRVIFQVSVEARDPVLERTLERTAVPELVPHEISSSGRGMQVSLVAQDAITLGEAPYHHPVPGGEDFVVAAGFDPPFASVKQQATRGL